jgi:tetratricopeptide (TPR) repeat protein
MRSRTFLLTLLLILLCMPLHARSKKHSAKPVASVVKSVSSFSANDRLVFNYFFQEALSARQQGRFDEAFDLFSYCTKLDSMSAQAWYETAVFYNNMKRSDLGLESMEKASKLDPTNDWYTFGLANMYLSLQMLPKAVSLYERLLKTRSDDENLNYQLASLYNQTERYNDALHAFSEVERLAGKNENVSLEKYKIYKQMGRNRKAIKEIQTLCAENAYDVDYILLLGDAYMDLNNPKEAFLQYEIAKKMDPANSAVALSLADYYNEVGDSAAAREQLKLVLTNPNTDVETKLTIFGPILSNAMVSADSVKIPGYFDLLLEQHPNDYKLRALHVQYLLQIGHKQEAKNELRNVLDLNPDQLQTWQMLLELTAEANHQMEIRTLCNQALTYFPKEPLFWFYLGLSWYPESDREKDPLLYQEAIHAFEQAITVSKPDNKAFISRMYGLIGDALLSLKEKDKAFENYEKALAEFPLNILVLNNYAYYLSEEEGGDLSKAERMSRKTIEAEPKNPTYLDTFAWIFFKEEKYSLAKIYMERAVANEAEPSSIILEHYGDILWFNEEKQAALEQWKKASELESPSEELIEKIQKSQYVKPFNRSL